MQARKLLPVGALAAWILLVGSGVRAELDDPEPVAIVRRAELDGPDLRLCIERAGRLATLSVDADDPDAPLLVEDGCADFGDGERVPVVPSEDARGALHIEGDAAVYQDLDGNIIRIPLDLDVDGDPYGPEPVEPAEPEEPSEPEEPPPQVPAPKPQACKGCIKRVPTRRGSSRIVLPGPRAGEIGDATRDATLGGLEQTLDPVTEPALALTLRGVSAAVGFVVGTVLYVPTTLLDVLETEYGDTQPGLEPDGDPDAGSQCDPHDGPYDPYDRHERRRRCR